MEPVAYRPRYCVWELTLECNLRCEHCGSRAGCARPQELDTAQCVDVVSQLADLDCRLITLSGGEPTLRADWEAIARAAVERKVTVNMVSNGTTITAEVAKRMAGCGLSNVGISLDGPEAINDTVRGAGTFRRAAKGMEELARAGVRMGVLTHLARSTAACLEEMHQVAVDLGACAWRVQLGKPMGRLCENRQRLLKPADLLTVLPRIAEIKRTSPIWVDVGDSVGYYGPHERTLRRTAWGGMQDVWSGCQAGRFAIGIESDGGVKGCLSLQASLDGCEGRDPFREGDLREKRLEQIWFAPDAFAFNRQQNLEELTGGCRGCRHASVCRGGAKCVAAAFTGALTEDPYCYYRVERLASRRARIASEVRKGAATALLGLGVSAGLGGCFSPVGEYQEPSPALHEGQDAGAAPAGPDASIVDPCENLCPMCDYGVVPPECYQRADASVPAGPDAATMPCVCPDYGVFPNPGKDCCGNPIVPAPVDAGTAPDAGDKCAHVCCLCDYGVEPPPECCN